MTTASIQVQGSQLGILWQIVSRVQPRSMAEQRGLSRIMREFGLDTIEAKLLLDPKTPVEMPKEPVTCEVTEAGYLYLCSQFDRLSELFPAGKAADGTEYGAGIPQLWSRLVDPLFIKLDEAFKLGDYAEKKAN